MIYDEAFYDMNEREARSSAEIIVPYLLTRYNPKSLLDVGCARGLWSSIAHAAGVPVFGIDMPDSTPDKLLIPADRYWKIDLESEIRTIRADYDMALCLEVAEHLTTGAGDRLVEWLCQSARVIVWSAAVPFQGGVSHINEQWPSYWHERFLKHGFTADGMPRLALWQRKEIQPYYRQNLMVYQRDGGPSVFTQDLVHPDLWTYKVNALTARK
jgi:hypothetical protein